MAPEMEIQGEPRRTPTPSTPEFMLKGKQLMSVERNHEWDLNDWQWNGNLFIAKPSNSAILIDDCRIVHPSLNGPSNEVGNGTAAPEKRRKVLTDGEFTLTDASLSLKLGEVNAHLSPELENGKCEGRDWKRSKPPLAVSNHPTCQVDGCTADLRLAKDYHRRHKVCEMHAKSASVSLGGVIQRFCQQCSRFHMLQEFDEEKRSCRRRLAGHNRRRRKMNIQSANGANSLNEENISRYILISILRTLSALHTNKSDQKNDEGILFQLLRMLTGSLNGTSQVELCRLVQSLQSPQSAETSNAVSSQGSPGFLPTSTPGPSRVLASANSVPSTIDTQDPAIINGGQSGNFAIKAAQVLRKVHNEIAKDNPGCLPVILDKQKEPDGSAKMEHNNTTWGRTHVKLNDFDLNDIYIESQDEREESDKLSPTTSSERFGAIQFGSSAGPLFSAQNNGQISPPQMSANSESASDKSPSSSSGEVQCCTERITFKLFGKDPSDLPHVLRSQILSWLSRSPTDIESYIRPGCIVLTIYVRLPRKTWQELSRNLIPKLKRLLEDSNDIFWTTGWICAKVGHQLAFIHNGRVLLDRSFLLSYEDTPMILSVTPIAVSFSEGATFTVKGTNLTSGTKKLCCAYQGKQLIHENSASCNEGNLSVDTFDCHEEIQYFRFTCSFPKTGGRGFIEIEDQELSTGFLPFIVAEDDICSELCTLENLMNDCDIDSGKFKERGEVLEFLHVFGWLLERFRLAYDLDFPNHQDSRLSNLEIKWLLEFSVEHDWCAVLKKLLNILFDMKIGLAYYYMEQLLDEVSLLHRAVRRNCGPMVEFLLNYVPQQNAVPQANISQLLASPLFRVDKKGPSGVTALHVAAETAGAERVLNILTSGPEECWLHTWESDRDDGGLTPEGLALQKGHDHYVQLIEQKKKKRPTIGHVATHMPNDVLQPFERASESVVNEWEQKPHGLQIDMSKTVVNEQKSHELQIDMSRTGQLQCKLCDRQSFYRSGQYRMLNYRPAILSMVAIAAVCVCVGILFKSPPEVTFILPPFRWESLGYGSI
ncbi:Squamosa promoter-binding-like protein 1 [Nymphaea thermarum]|nr:Squamosa promoter-binding-like protein 1 [Nymphaea thermarum]